jgi:BlaI family penicillinase repressor
VSKRPQAVTDAELAVLKVLWQNGLQPARGLTEAIYPGGAESEFASVHSFLQRLERKGLVTRDRRAAPHIFSAAVSQADVVGSELTALADRLGDGSLAPLIMHLVAQKRLTKKEAAEIRRILDQYAK